ncbi:2-isopropylmalate synthase [Candidatus Tremblaya phenacola]|uniref:2-isopropylmalate synthase n=1 Tax=Candidatus Tremblayella phenacoccinincola TaxID=1010676 RepID=UPI001330FAF1|nr:2-isopropylmalate synthase [Candidatus Tremblaya phenacola]KAH0998167.1 2-isopropylmalate synthase [Candidatus Tremblaya phenacola]
MSKSLIILDTTLRDGEQAPGVLMSPNEKLIIARKLELMKVNIIEAGFAASSVADFKSIKNISAAVKNCTICSLARANKSDIELAAEALKPASRSRIHTFIATSEIHIRNKLRTTPEHVYEAAKTAVRFARKYTDDVEFSPEDCSRSNISFLSSLLECVINEGANTINITDTVGIETPGSFGSLVKRIKENIPNSDKATFSVHCHNDLGLAVANTLAGIKQGGAKQVECTVNGIGERSGNAPLEEVVMALNTKRQFFGMSSQVDTKQILSLSNLVAKYSDLRIQPTKPIVGQNAFAHASGIHQDGILKCRETYEIMNAKDIGWKKNRIVLGKLSGSNAFKYKLKELNVRLNRSRIIELFHSFKHLASLHKKITNSELNILTSTNHSISNKTTNLAHFYLCYSIKHGSYSRTTFTLPNGKCLSSEAFNQSSLSSIANCINSFHSLEAQLKTYSCLLKEQVFITNIVIKKIRLEQTEVTIKTKDIIQAFTNAYSTVLNKCI